MRRLARLIAIAALAASIPGSTALSTSPRHRQPTAAEAEAFVDWLYQRYRLADANPAEWAEEHVYSVELRRLFARWRQLAATYGLSEPELELDPLCRCRDWADFALLERRARGSMNRTEIAVRFRSRGAEERLQVWVRGEPEGVRVVNIVPDDAPRDDLRNRLRLAIRRVQIAHGLPTD